MGTASKRKLQKNSDECVDSDSETQNQGLTTLLDPPKSKKARKVVSDSDLCLIGPPIPADEARQRWPLRYQSKNKIVNKRGVNEASNDEETEVLQAKNHYSEAMVDGCLYKLGDNAYVKAEDGNLDYIARIVEFFETVDKEPFFKAQWFYRAQDTVINKENSHLIDERRVFLSDIQDDNPLNCIVSKVEITQVASDVDLAGKEKIPESGLYYNMKYSLQHLTFRNIFTEMSKKDSGASSVVSSECDSNDCKSNNSDVQRSGNSDKYLLDLYSGCGAMSTGLCMGASLAGIKLITRWAVDINSFACKSLQWNHPETKVRNEKAEDFLSLLKEWEKLCQQFSLLDPNKSSEGVSSDTIDDEDNDGEGCEEEKEEQVKEEDKQEVDNGSEDSSEDFEVERLLDICFGDPNGVRNRGLHFKVRWKGYDKSYDTWEPLEGLSNCQEKLEEFVRKGYKSNILPLPGSVYFICGGPPCQGISGFNRFRNSNAPLEDAKNKQLVVYMDTIEHLKPKYVLMENVVDILKFAKGFLGRYAVGRLVSMNYQSRMGMMAAGNYGVAQFRMRVFLWGAHPSQKLPQYPLPTHEVLSRGLVPNEFEEIHVAYDKKDSHQLESAITLGDAISDLPQVNNDESQDQRKYGTTARTEFQKFIRLQRKNVVNLTVDARHASTLGTLYDHQPLHLNADDYERVCQIPKKKGANFRDLPGVKVNEKNRVEWDTTMERVLVKSGKPLVPEYAMKFVKGRSTKPFGRLWMDEIINTVVTRAEPHNQCVIHPSQDRVLTIRENARLQGFPDCYKLFGTIKERYMQVGNAVAVPVAISLGYALGLACQNLCDDEPLMTLPFKFPNCLERSSQVEEDDASD